MGDSDDMETSRRRLVWRAGHRGMRELDLLLGAYAREHVAHMDADAIAQFESILAVADTELYDWIMGASPVPAQYRGPIIDGIRQFRLPSDHSH